MCTILLTEITGCVLLVSVFIPALMKMLVVLSFLLMLADFSLKIIGLGLMVHVRREYPRNKFGKILMWIYIVLIIIFVTVFINFNEFFIKIYQTSLEFLSADI